MPSITVCPDFALCLGQNLCESPHAGLLCGACEPGYQRTFDSDRCVPCSEAMDPLAVACCRFAVLFVMAPAQKGGAHEG